MVIRVCGYRFLRYVEGLLQTTLFQYNDRRFRFNYKPIRIEYTMMIRT